MNDRTHDYYVYIVASRSHTLYCGITNSIRRRIQEHRDGRFDGFSATFKCNRLVWFEHFRYVQSVIAREKQIKRWRRDKKIWLIEISNPAWVDLSETWREPTAGPSTALRSGRDDNSR